MGQIVQLSQYRRPKARRTATPSVPPRATAGPTPPHYFCLRCDTDQFKLFPGGTIHCGHCGALMRNITVSDRGSS